MTIGKNKPLHSEKQWKSETPITMGQLRSKRDEYWETQPAFEGRREIWDALHAACTACETNDLTLAQAIVDGANITLPTGIIFYIFYGYVLSAMMMRIKKESKEYSYYSYTKNLDTLLNVYYGVV